MSLRHKLPGHGNFFATFQYALLQLTFLIFSTGGPSISLATEKKEAPPTSSNVTPKKEENYNYGIPRKVREKSHVPASSTEKPVNPPEAKAEEKVETPAEKTSEFENTLTGNWGGARDSMAEKGLVLNLTYKGEFNRVMSGGVQQRNEYLDNLDFKSSFDFEKMGAWKGFSAFLYILGNHGGDPTANAGDSQTSSNIETPANTVKIYEAWVQQQMMDDKVSILLGLHDLNSEFYTTETSTLFLNSSFGVEKELAQTGLNGPSIFPTTSPAARLRVSTSENFYLQTAAFNAVSGDPDEPYGTHFRAKKEDGLLMISEFAFTPRKSNSDEQFGKYGMGFWNYSHASDHLLVSNTDAAGNTVAAKENNRGIYFLGDQSLGDSFSIFVRYGTAASEINNVESCLTSGVVVKGLIPGRDEDRFGLGVARATLGQEYKDLQESSGTLTMSSETAWEMSYRLELGHGLSVQPDFQIIQYPNFDPGIPTANVGAIRLEVNF